MNRKFISDLDRFTTDIKPEDLLILESITEGTHALTYEKLLENLNIPEHIIIDSALSVDSENPVQNKAIFTKFNEIIESINTVIDTVNNLDIPDEVLVDIVLDPESTNAIQNKVVTVAITEIRESITNLGTTISELDIPEEVIVDEELSNESTNPVQNKAVNTAIENINQSITELQTTINNLDIPDGVIIDENLDKESTNPIQNKTIATLIETIQESINIINTTISELNIPEEVIVDSELKEESTNPVQNSVLVVKLNEIDTAIANINTTISELNIPDAVTIDNELSIESENPIQNKVIANLINTINESINNITTTINNLDIPPEITVDAMLSAESENPVQNKVIVAALDEIKETIPSVDTSLMEESTNPVQNRVINEALAEIRETINNLNIPDAVIVDTELSSTSENPVQNKILASLIEGINTSISNLTERISALEANAKNKYEITFASWNLYNNLKNVVANGVTYNGPFTNAPFINKLSDLVEGSKCSITFNCKDNYIFTEVPKFVSGSGQANIPAAENVTTTLSEDKTSCTLEFIVDQSYTGVGINGVITEMIAINFHHLSFYNIKAIIINDNNYDYTNTSGSILTNGSINVPKNSNMIFKFIAQDNYIFDDTISYSITNYLGSDTDTYPVPSCTTTYENDNKTCIVQFVADKSYNNLALDVSSKAETVNIYFHHISGSNIQSASINGKSCTVASGGSYISTPTTEFNKGTNVIMSFTAADGYKFDGTTTHQISNYNGSDTTLYPIPSCTTTYENDNKTCIIQFTADKSYSALALSGVSASIEIPITYKIKIGSVNVNDNVDSIKINGNTYTATTNSPLTQQLYLGANVSFDVTKGETLEVIIKSAYGTGFSSSEYPTITQYETENVLASTTQMIPNSPTSGHYYTAKISYTPTSNKTITINAKPTMILEPAASVEPQ